MKVLMLGWEYPPHYSGGLGQACQGLAQALAESGVDVAFVLPRAQSVVNHDNVRFLFAGLPHVKIHEIHSSLQPYASSNSYASSVAKDLKNKGLYGATLFDELLRYAELVSKIANQENFDVIHAHDWLSFLAGIEAKRVSGKPLVLHVHATSFDQAGRMHVNPQQFSIEKFAMEQADMVVTVSQFVKETVTTEHGISPEKVLVIHNGLHVEPEQEHATYGDIIALKQAGKKIVLSHGRLTIQKGADYFLRAAKRVAEYEPDTFFVMSGTGDMERQLIELSAELGISEKVIFTGALFGSARNAVYRSADIFVMPSVSEPFGLTPLEALSIGSTPTIISKQSGVMEVLKNTLTVDFWDTDEMANQIISVLRNKVLSDQLVEYGQGEALGITWNKAAVKCIDLYSKLTKKYAFS